MCNHLNKVVIFLSVFQSVVAWDTDGLTLTERGSVIFNFRAPNRRLMIDIHKLLLHIKIFKCYDK